MLTWIKIGLRNLLKNKRRSLFTVSAVGLAFAAVNVFGGFMRYIYHSFEDGYVYAQGSGHLSISRENYRREGQQNPAAFLLRSNELATIGAVLERDPRVRVVSPELRMQGLISNGRVSTIFIARGLVPELVTRIRQSLGKSWIKNANSIEGRRLSEDAPFGIVVGTLLMERLGLNLDADVIMMGLTVDGQMNALDAQIIAHFAGGGDQISDKIVSTTLSFLQQLYDTDGADTVNVLLTDGRHTDAARDELTQRIRDTGVPVEIGTWYELAPSYEKTVAMFNVIFAFIFAIVFVIVALSVVNTVSMAVIERTREIGTLRALGMKRHGVVVLFATESALLAFIGSLLGIALTLLTSGLVAWLKPTWTPPMMTGRIPIEVRLVGSFMLQAAVGLVVLAVLAAVSPARRAARANIVDSLGHV